MYSDSTLYTIGTALNRAEANHSDVSILVEGQWLSGQIAGVDGHGVVLASSDNEHAVIRMGSISAVRMYAEAPHRDKITAGGAFPMGAG